MNLVLCHNLRQRGPYMNNSLPKVLKSHDGGNDMDHLYYYL